MTISAFRSRSGDVPPGCIDGFCTICKRDVIADERDPRCDNCGQQLHPASLPRVPDTSRNGVQADESASDAVDVPVETVRPLAVRNGAAAAPPAVKTRVLPPTKAARRWHAATDDLVAEAEADEATKKAAYETAKSEYEAAAQFAHYARQMRQLARVDGASPSGPVEVKARRSAPSLDGRWAREFDHCVNCGGTEYKHGARGYCKRGSCEKANKANREAQTHD